jgi:hypothetical protein
MEKVMYNQMQTPYNQPVDPITQRTPVAKRGYIVGTLLRYASGRLSLTLPAVGAWFDVEKSATGEQTIVKVRQNRKDASKPPWKEAVGRIYSDNGKWLVDIPLFDVPMELLAPQTDARQAAAPVPAMGPAQPPIPPATNEGCSDPVDEIPF